MRVIDTIKLNPSLASQAPKVSKTMARCGINIIVMQVIVTTISIAINIIASKQNNVIRKWENWRINARRARIKQNINIVISLGDM